MRELISGYSVWFLGLNASRIVSLLLLIAIFLDAKRAGVLPKALKFVLAPFAIGLVFVEALHWWPMPSILLCWFCLGSVYYVALRFQTLQGGTLVWCLTKAFALNWTIYTALSCFGWWLVATHHINFIMSPIRDNAPLYSYLTGRFIWWLALVLAASLLGYLFRGKAASSIAAPVASQSQ